jgi:uncharacterized protein YybS (DUF2232 family)
MRRSRLSTRGLTEGAIQAALVAVLALLTRYVPLAVLATTFLMPLPLMVLTIRHGVRPAVLAAVVSGVVAGMLSGDLLTGVGILVAVAPFGIMVGWGTRRGWSGPAIVGVAVLVSGASLVVNGLLLLAFLGINPVQQYGEMVLTMRQQMDTAASLYGRLGLGQEAAESYRRTMLAVLDLMPRLVLFGFVATAVTTGWLNYEIARPILRRVGHPLPALPPASTWRLPGFALWLLPLAWLISALGWQPVTTLSDRLRSSLPPAPLPVPSDLGLNLLALLSVALLVQGVIVGWVFLGRYRLHRALRVLLLLWLTFNPIFSNLLLIVGLVDSVFPLRERLGRRAAPAEVKP